MQTWEERKTSRRYTTLLSVAALTLNLCVENYWYSFLILLALFGGFCNQLVISKNGGKMPVKDLPNTLYDSPLYQPLTQETKQKLLVDRFPFQWRGNEYIFSIGDLIMLAAFWLAVFTFVGHLLFTFVGHLLN